MFDAKNCPFWPQETQIIDKRPDLKLYLVGLIYISGVCVCAKEMLLKVLQSIALKVEFPQVESNAVQCSILWKLLHCAIRMNDMLKNTQFNAMF